MDLTLSIFVKIRSCSQPLLSIGNKPVTFLIRYRYLVKKVIYYYIIVIIQDHVISLILIRYHSIPKKCSVMHYGAKNTNFENSMNKEGTDPHILKVTSVERDLGVIMSNNLKWANHIQFAVAKANKTIGIIRKSFKCLDLISRILLYCSLVRLGMDDRLN